MFVTSSAVALSTVCVVHNTCLRAAVSERYLPKKAVGSACQFPSVTFPGKSEFSEKVGEENISSGERKCFIANLRQISVYLHYR